MGTGVGFGEAVMSSNIGARLEVLALSFCELPEVVGELHRREFRMKAV